jgi:hypothetical protein
VVVQGEMKIIGRRRGWKGGVDAMDGMLKLAVALREGRPMIPRGVHRFRSHEEADAWMLRMLAR